MPKRKNNLKAWFTLGLIAAFVEAPNATAIKYITNNADIYLFNFLRFLSVAVVTLPFLLAAIPKFNKRTLRNSLSAAMHMTIAVFAYIWAIKLSQASYVSIVTLLTPIIFILLSLRLTKDKITSRALAGITLAVIGALIIVVLPVAIKQNADFVFYPWASVLALVNSVTFSLSVIHYKKANEAGMPMTALMGVTAWFLVITSAVCMGLTHEAFALPKAGVLYATLYSGIVVALLARILNVVTYEHLGSSVTSVLAYTETLVAIIIPVIVLHEKLSIEVVMGGIFILLGLYVVEHHKSSHHKHFHLFRIH